RPGRGTGRGSHADVADTGAAGQPWASAGNHVGCGPLQVAPDGWRYADGSRNQVHRASTGRPARRSPTRSSTGPITSSYRAIWTTSPVWTGLRSVPGTGRPIFRWSRLHSARPPVITP